MSVDADGREWLDTQGHDVDTLAMAAVRYALGRQSYVTAEVARAVERAPISERAARIIAWDIAEAITGGKAGHAEIDVPVWRELRESLARRFPAAVPL